MKDFIMAKKHVEFEHLYIRTTYSCPYIETMIISSWSLEWSYTHVSLLSFVRIGSMQNVAAIHLKYILYMQYMIQ